jgi:hypothetical protein
MDLRYVPRDLIEQLRNSAPPPSSLAELAVLGVPEHVISALREVVAREGHQEEAVVAAFIALIIDRLDNDGTPGNTRASLAGHQYRALRQAVRSVVDRALANPWS